MQDPSTSSVTTFEVELTSTAPGAVGGTADPPTTLHYAPDGLVPEPATSAQEQAASAVHVASLRLVGPRRYHDLGINLGQGGQGTVRLAYDRFMKRKVAIKSLHSKIPIDPDRPISEEMLAAGRLQHPHILTILDVFWDPSRACIQLVTPYVEGQTLQSIIKEATDNRAQWPIVRVVDLLIMACQGIAQAHNLGLAHRDIKSDNILVVPAVTSGTDECYVIDWGLAGPVAPDASRQPDWLLPVRGGGTVGLMAPEVADRSVKVSLRADVYSIGCLIFELLEGRRPYEGSNADVLKTLCTRPAAPRPRDAFPAGLADLAQRCMAADPVERPRDATSVINALTVWRSQASMLQLADQIYAEARMHEARVRRMRRLQDSHRTRLQAARSQIQASSTDTQRERVWRLRESLDELEEDIGACEARIDICLQTTLQTVPRHRAAQAFHASRIAGRLQDSEGQHPAAIRRLEVALTEADVRGRYTGLLKGLGALTLCTDRPTMVSIQAWHRRGDRFVAGDIAYLGPSELEKFSLRRGLYVASFRSPGTDVRMPIWIARGQHEGLGPGGTVLPVQLPHADERGADEVYVPRGRSWMGGDPRAQGDRLPEAHRVWVENNLMVRQHTTTVGEWCEMLDDLRRHDRMDEAMACVPRTRGAAGSDGSPILKLDPATGRHHPVPDAEGHVWQDDWPIFAVPQAAIDIFVAWRRERDGLDWRLPREDEWMRIARGADQRSYPWGHAYEPGFAALLDAQTGDERLPFPVGSFPRDVSPFGPIFDLSGGLMQRMGHGHTAEPQLDGERLLVPPLDRIQALRGGTWFGAPGKARVCGRTSSAANSRSSLIGFRLVRSVVPKGSAQ